jgi:hypothetical protein
MLGDEEWLAKHTESWRAALIDLRDGLIDELASPRPGQAERSWVLTSPSEAVKSHAAV